MDNIERSQAQIHEKGFSFDTNFNKIKVGVKNLEDAVLTLGNVFQKTDNQLSCKAVIVEALRKQDLPKLREISRYFYNTSGIYKNACDYFATLYRYDWYIQPEIFDTEIKEKKVLKDFNTVLSYLDNSHIRKICGDMTLKVVVDGAYYGYIVDSDDKIAIQELPVNYCRSRYSVGDLPAVELDMRFFDEQFPDAKYRLQVLKLFPKEVQKGYLLYKEGKLPSDFIGAGYGSWYLLDPEKCFKFNCGLNDFPMCINAIPLILDLDAAQDLDRRKQMQKLLKILIQKLPMDKNGDLVFDVDEAKDIHNNAVKMLRRAVGVDVLTTFADVSVEDMSDSNTTTTQDDLMKVERTVYNSLGISQNLFNPDGNLSLNNSILTDESSMRGLLFQLEILFDRLAQLKNPDRKKYKFRFQMLETTQFNYQALSKLYKEHTQLGYSKMLPQIALGHNQSSILNTAYFENEVLHLSEIMIPPMSSNTMNAQALSSSGSGNSKNDDKKETISTNKKEEVKIETKSTGRPEKPDSEKSDKTIQNKESLD